MTARNTVILIPLLLFACSTGFSQACPSATDYFWKRDALPGILPQIPTGVSVIQGICEGESAAVVFEVPPGMPPQQLTQVVAPWGAQGGVGGFSALLDLEVYDGVTFSGGIPNMGTQVFSLTGAGSSMQASSHGLNALDVTAFNIVVGTSPVSRKFAIAFRIDLNNHPTGSCANGWPANFFTDNATQFSTFCNPTITPPQTSLIQITGQGWRDAATATVSGVPLCPIFYAGVWVIRACSRDAAPANPFQVVPLSPLPVTAPNTLILRFDLPGFQGFPYVAAASLGTMPGIATPFGTIPLNQDLLFDYSLNPALSSGIFLNFTGIVGATGSGTGLVNIPPGLSNFVFYVACVGLPPAPNAWAISDALAIPIQ
jgi:hypothetical protein